MQTYTHTHTANTRITHTHTHTHTPTLRHADDEFRWLCGRHARAYLIG